MAFVTEEERLAALELIDPRKEPIAWIAALDRRIAALVELRRAFARAYELGCFVPSDAEPKSDDAVARTGRDPTS